MDIDWQTTVSEIVSYRYGSCVFWMVKARSKSTVQFSTLGCVPMLSKIQVDVLSPGYEMQENISPFHPYSRDTPVNSAIPVSKIDTNPVLNELTVKQERQA